MADILCPNCGRPNPDYRDTCFHCDQALPESSSGDDWISSLRLGDDIYREEDQVEWAGPDEEPAGSAIEAERLERIASGSLAESPGSPENLPEIPVDATVRAEQPDWLKALILASDREAGAEHAGAEHAGAEHAGAAPGGESDPDPAAAVPTPQDEFPDWLSELSAPAAAAADEPEGELPSWLSELSAPAPEPEDQPAAEPAAEPAGDLPGWLSELAAPELDQEDASEITSEFAPEFAAEPDESPAPARAEMAGEEAMENMPLPDWLAALAAEDADTAEPDPFDAMPAGPSQETGGPDGDWLAGFFDEPGEERPAPETEEFTEDESPDWLAGFIDDRTAGEKAPPREERSAEHLPGWMTGLPEPARESVWETSPEPASDLPPWLIEFEKAGAAGQEPETAGRPFDSAKQEAEPARAAPADPEEMPDWLTTALGQVAPADEAEVPIDAEAFEALEAERFAEAAEKAVPAAEPALQDWLSRFDEQGELAGKSEADPEPAMPGVPDWLQEVHRVESGADTAAQEADIPDWLRELNEQTPEVQMEAPARADAEEAEPDPLDWMPAGTRNAAFEMLSEEEAVEEDLAPGELPAWLRSMRPIDATAPGVMETGESDTGSFERVGPLAGLRGVLSAEPMAAQAGRPPSHSVRLQVSDSQQNRSNQLQKMVQGETEARPAGRRAILSEQRVLRYLIAGLLFGTTLLANLLPARMNDLPAKPPEMDAVTPLVAALTPESAVLVVLDYQPGMSAELDTAAAGVLDHVMLQGARLALVSTTPTGPALGERLVRGVHVDHEYLPGEDYVNLGFLPGGATGLRLLATDPLSAIPAGYDARPFWSLVDQPSGSPWVQPAMQGVAALADFDLTLLLSDDPETVRRWVEQAGPALRPNTLIVVASAQAEPLVRPYLEAGQVAAIVAGLRGGAAYEGFLHRDGPARGAWDGVTVGTLVSVVLILGAGTYNLYLFWNERELDRKSADRKNAGRRGGVR